MGLDLLITSDNNETSRLEITEDLHSEIFSEKTRWSSHKELRKIKDYYKTNVTFTKRNLTDFISDLSETKRSIEKNKEELQTIIEKLKYREIKSLRVTGD